MGDYKKVKICRIENGFLVKRRKEKAHFIELDKALEFTKIVLCESRVEYTFGQILSAVKENKVEKLELIK